MPDPVTLLVADDHAVVADAISRLLAQWYLPLPVVTRFADLPETLQRERPTILLLDVMWESEQVNALTEVRRILQASPETLIVVLTGFGDRGFLDTALAAGVQGYVLKESAPTELRVVIEEVLAGRTYVTPVIAGPEGFDMRTTIEPLSDLQWAILQRKQAGMTHESIALELHHHVSVIGYHCREIRRKLGILPQVPVRWDRIVVVGKGRRSLANPREPATGAPIEHG